MRFTASELGHISDGEDPAVFIDSPLFTCLSCGLLNKQFMKLSVCFRMLHPEEQVKGKKCVHICF